MAPRKPASQKVERATPTTEAKSNLFEFASSHFLLISTLTIVVGVLCATVFLFAYLSVFDWRLIWVIEYTDILKVGLVAIAVLSGFSYWIGSIVEAALGTAEGEETEEHAKRRIKGMLIGLGFILVSLVVFLMLSYWRGESGYWLIILVHFTLALFLSFVFFTVARLRNLSAATPSKWAGDFFYTVLLVYFVGATIGNWTREGRGFNRDVFTLHGEFREVGLIMITSRYVLLLRDGHSLVLPVGEVTKIEERPRHTS